MLQYLFLLPNSLPLSPQPTIPSGQPLNTSGQLGTLLRLRTQWQLYIRDIFKFIAIWKWLYNNLPLFILSTSKVIINKSNTSYSPLFCRWQQVISNKEHFKWPITFWFFNKKKCYSSNDSICNLMICFFLYIPTSA